MGGGPEKLLTLEEAARRLGIPADDVEAYVRSGNLTSFRLGGSLLRVRLRDVERLQTERLKGQETRGPNDLVARFVDFIHFNDFYLVAILSILTLLAIIFAL